MEQTATGTRGSALAFRIVAWIFTAGAFFGYFGLAVITAWFDNSDGGIHRVHYMGFGALYGVLLTTGLLAQNWHPGEKISAFYQILDVGLATLIAGLIATSAPGIYGGLVLLVAYGILFALHPNRSLLTHPQREGFSLVLLVLTIVGAIPLIWFALSSASLQRNGFPTDLHVKNAHWMLMASMAIGIVLVAFLSSFKFKGWRISAWSASVAVFLYGLISVVYPHKAGSEGTGWGWTAMIGGVVFALAAELDARTST